MPAVYYPGLDDDPRGLPSRQMRGPGAALTHRPVAAGARPPQGLVRLSIGLEDVEDLIADLDAALGRRQGRPVPQSRGPAGDARPVAALRQSLVS